MIGTTLGALSVAIMGLILFGVGYNAAFEYAENRGYAEGFTWVWVIGGVAVTLGVVALLDWQAAGLTFVCFAASGLFMALGAIKRYVAKRAAEQAAYRKEVR